MFNKKQFILSLLGLIALLLLIGYGGPRLSKYSFDQEKITIDKNGFVIKAMVSKKRQFKGHLIYFRYTYKSRLFTNREQDGDFYEKINIGDSIEIKIDTTNPKNAYILNKSNK